MTTLYKFLNPEGLPAHGGTGKWHLPSDKRPGEWMPKVNGKVVLCENGYHLLEAHQLIDWLAPELWLAEGRGDTVPDDTKSAWREVRLLRRVDTWNDRTARLFAADCAEHVLPLFEAKRPDDKQVTPQELAATRASARASGAAAGKAAGDAAWASARAAAGSTTWAAGRAAGNAYTATWTAAWAAENAAYAAKWAAAYAATWAAERKWQSARLIEMLEVSR